ncbi:hypothetical protein [Lacrimispora brassicae]
MPGCGNYNKYPVIAMPGPVGHVYSGTEAITAELKQHVNKNDFMMVFDCYPGVNDEEMLQVVKLHALLV